MEGLNLEKCSIKILDDIAIWDETEAGLYRKVRSFLNKCRDYNVAISIQKFEISQSVPFAGHIISDKGISIADDKLAAIKSFPMVQNVSQTRSYLGLAQHFSRHFGDLAMVLEPLRALLKKNVAFNITPELEKAFEESKKILCSSPILQPFRKGLKTAILAVCMAFLCCGESRSA